MDSSNHSGISKKSVNLPECQHVVSFEFINGITRKILLKGNFILLIFLVIVSSTLLSCVKKKFTGIPPAELRCEYSINPLGIENNNPKLSWILQSGKRSQKQFAYRILVASSEEKLERNIGDKWNSGRVKSDQTSQIAYKGKTLNSGLRYWWKVRVWDKDKKMSGWSKPSFWEMGLLKKDDWKANWIGYDCASAPLFRKEFEITKQVKEARVYISGLGYYELNINGSKIGDHVLDPGQTDYEQRIFYVVYDITQNIKQGLNAVGVILGDGYYNQTAVNHGRYGWKDVVYGKPRLFFQLHLSYSDESDTLIISDETWKGSSGPVTSNNIYAGEIYDARLEQYGWDTPGFDDSNWNKVHLMESPGGKLVSQKLPPIKKIKSIKPVALLSPKPGVYVYDLGQNFAGWAKIKLKADKGTEIRLQFAEWLKKDGTIDPGSTGVYATEVVQTDKYIAKGQGVEIWEPRFTYHGFRYVEMTGFPGKPALEDLEGVVVHTDVEKAGEFKCSDEMINRIHSTALWTELSNMHSIPTDCPHREKCGWLGDAFLTSDMTIYNFNTALFWSKFIGDIETSRRGDVPANIAPGRRMGGKDPDWGAAFIQLPYQLFLYYGDTSVISEYYEGMSFFMNYLQSIAEDNIIYKGIGSLFSPGRIMPLETPKEFTSTVLYYYCTVIMSKMAGRIGKNDDSEKYRLLAEKIKTSFNDKFYNNVEKTYGGQEKNVLALAFGLTPVNDEQVVADNLNMYVAEKNKGHISTGVFGSRYIYETLGKHGYGEDVKTMLDQTSFPSYGYLFSRGATTFWENWGELKFEDRKGAGDDRSKNHPFQGGFDAWFYNGIAGINPDPDNPGFKHIILQPQIINSLESAEAYYESIHGLIRSKWQNSPDRLTWSISIPANTTATVYIPAENKDAVTESGIPAAQSDGVKFLKVENKKLVFEIGSGNYFFSINKQN